MTPKIARSEGDLSHSHDLHSGGTARLVWLSCALLGNASDASV